MQVCEVGNRVFHCFCLEGFFTLPFVHNIYSNIYLRSPIFSYITIRIYLYWYNCFFEMILFHKRYKKKYFFDRDLWSWHHYRLKFDYIFTYFSSHLLINGKVMHQQIALKHWPVTYFRFGHVLLYSFLIENKHLEANESDLYTVYIYTYNNTLNCFKCF